MYKLVVFAGGNGERMLPKTKNTNKVLLEYYSKPIIQHCLTPFIKLGIKDIIVLTSYMAVEVEKTVSNFEFPHVEYSFIRGDINLNSRIRRVDVNEEDKGVLTVHGNIIISEEIVSIFLNSLDNYRGDFLLLSSETTENFHMGHPFVFEEFGKKKCVLGYPKNPINNLKCCIGLNYMSYKSVNLIKSNLGYSIPEDLIINQDVDFETVNTDKAIKHFENVSDLR